MMRDIESIENATHLVWLAGGSLIPEEEWERVGLYNMEI